jgi:hypothetical protein
MDSTNFTSDWPAHILKWGDRKIDCSVIHMVHQWSSTMLPIINEDLFQLWAIGAISSTKPDCPPELS